jgi:hypothetical protein
MGTVADLIESARYDLQDYEKGLDFDDRMMYLFLNRMVGLMDSQLTSLNSGLVHGTETNIDTVADQNYVDLTWMNNTQWDSLRSVWIGNDRKQEIPLDLMYYKRKFRSGSAEPEYWALEGRRIIFEVDADAAHTDLVIHYNKKTRKILESWTDTFTANATTDKATLVSGNHNFVTGDGPFQVSNSGGALPTGLSASTDYWIVYDPTDRDSFQFSTSKDNALAGTVVDITATGSGTQTVTLQPELLPYDGIFDEYFREIVVLHAASKQEGQVRGPDAFYERLFRKRAFEETIRRDFVPKYYRIDY